jgi:hypothetical protein
MALLYKRTLNGSIALELQFKTQLFIETLARPAVPLVIFLSFKYKSIKGDFIRRCENNPRLFQCNGLRQYTSIS